MKNNYLIGEFSHLTGFSIETLRYYEKEKILNPKRNKNNIRIYSKDDIKWMDFIKKLKSIGMSIKNIKLYSELRTQGNNTLIQRKKLLEEQLIISKEQLKILKQNIQKTEEKILLYENLIKNK